jgi:L-iditol 2-dehydrogenase
MDGIIRGTKEAPMTVPKTMTATVLVAPHRFELRECPVPEPGPEDALLRVRACGV